MKKFFSLTLLGALFFMPLTACSSPEAVTPADPPITEEAGGGASDSGDPNESAP